MKNIEKFIREELHKIIKTNDYIDNEQKLTAIGLDSLSFIRLLVAIEEHYNIFFDDMNLSVENYDSVGKLIEQTYNCICEVGPKDNG